MKHDIFEWENYGVKWEIDHIIPFELMDRYSVLARYKLNNYVNLQPKTSEQNKKERAAKLAVARTKTHESQSSKTLYNLTIVFADDLHFMSSTYLCFNLLLHTNHHMAH
jgi:hypothetical protein